jgi:hypothetical protein
MVPGSWDAAVRLSLLATFEPLYHPSPLEPSIISKLSANQGCREYMQNVVSLALAMLNGIGCSRCGEIGYPAGLLILKIRSIKFT